MNSIERMLRKRFDYARQTVDGQQLSCDLEPQCYVDPDVFGMALLCIINAVIKSDRFTHNEKYIAAQYEFLIWQRADVLNSITQKYDYLDIFDPKFLNRARQEYERQCPFADRPAGFRDVCDMIDHDLY